MNENSELKVKSVCNKQNIRGEMAASVMHQRARDDSEIWKEGFKPLSKHRPNTFTGDTLSLEYLYVCKS